MIKYEHATTLYIGLYKELKNKIEAPFTYKSVSKFEFNSNLNFKNVKQIIENEKERLTKLNYIILNIKFTNFNKSENILHFILNVKNNNKNYTFDIDLLIYNNTNEYKKELEKLKDSYAFFIKYNNKKLDSYNLQGFIPCGTHYNCSYSFSRSYLILINKKDLSIKKQIYSDIDYEYQADYDTHDYIIEDMKKDINPFNKKFYNYSLLLQEKNNKEICKGSIVEVISGRKIEKGYKNVVVGLQRIQDKYNRYIGTYVLFADGKRTNKKNVKLISYVSNIELSQYI